MLAVIWQSPNTAETLFLVAAVVFFIEALVILATGLPRRGAHAPLAEGDTLRGSTIGWASLLQAAGFVLTALGLLAL